jgi:molybdopterin synthase sulfur carrier subunit
VTTVRVVLPGHLKRLAEVEHEVSLDLDAEPVSLQVVLDALEAAYPVLGGTIRDRGTGKRRAFVRFFACEQDLSHEPVDAPLPPDVLSGREPLLVVGAMAGG